MIDFALGEEENTSPAVRAPMAEASTSSACAPRYKCGFPGCNKRYASTDGVRKHARKTHTQWLKDVDQQSSLRDHKLYGNKPSTYCTMEAPEGHPATSLPNAAPGSLPEQLLQQFLARYQAGGGNPGLLLGAAEATPAGLAALTPGSMLLPPPPPSGAGCKRDAASSLFCPPALLDPCEASKRQRVPSLWASQCEEDDVLDDSSSSLSSSPRASADFSLTPLTAPLPRPLSGSGEVSPFRLDKPGEEAMLPQGTCLEPQPLCRSDSPQVKPAASCDDFASFTMDDDECAAFLRTILA